MDRIRIPQFLSTPLQVGFLEADTAILAFLTMTITLVMDVSWYWLMIASMTIFFYTRIKKNYNRGFLKHCFYSMGLSYFSIKGMPMAYELDFHE